MADEVELVVKIEHGRSRAGGRWVVARVLGAATVVRRREHRPPRPRARARR